MSGAGIVSACFQRKKESSTCFLVGGCSVLSFVPVIRTLRHGASAFSREWHVEGILGKKNIASNESL